MRACLLATLLLAPPALAGAPTVLAPAGVCAGEEPDLVVRLLPRAKSAEDALAPASSLSGVLHLSPMDVSAASAFATLAAPNFPAFGGTGACDNPGSGCIPDKIADDPNPGTGCGFPGSPCP
ncbi:MAG TPA: hypothetical protein VII78_07025 [Myxococcota bacterium]|jgi:hypothetical protein